MREFHADKRRGLRALRSVLLANLFLVPAMPAFADGELPSGGQIVAGSGTIGAAGNALTVTQSSSRAIINWQSFSIGNGNSVQINNGSGATLNRVISNSPSSLGGSLTSTGSTYLINQNGIVITPTGKVVTGGSFIGSTRDTSNSAFMQGQAPQFTGSSSGSVVNQGKIVSTGGDVVLVGKSVNNSGSVSAKNGTAALVAGDDVTLQPSGSGLQIKVTAGSGDATNSGTVEAAQAMLNAAGGNVYALAGNNGGTIRATGSAVIGGHVWLTAGGQASVTGGVSAQNADGSGGAIAVTGHDIDISGSLDVSAYSPFGSGGSASVIAGGATKVTGAIKARAGSQGGNGGSIETSGNILNIGGAAIDASAPAGLAGTWLLDPYSLTVGASPSDATQSPTGTWTSNAGGGLVLNTDINNALNAGTSVVLQTSGSLGDGFGNGDITVGAAIQMTGLSNASLTLKAAGSIDILQGISSTGGALGVTLNANTLGGGGYVNIGAAISTNGGDLVVGGGANPLTLAAVGTAAQINGVLVNGTINTSGGAVTINGAGYGGSVNGTANNGVSIAAAINAGGGAISITGTGGNSSGNNNAGINQTAAIATTGAGSITLNGTGAGSGNGESGYQTNANITAGTGNISITGVSSAAATGTSTRGVGLLGGTVSTAGTGTITIAGTVFGSGSGASAISSNGVVTAVDGLISLTGIDNSNSTGSGNNGVNINTVGSAIRSTGIGGVKIIGQGGGSGASANNSGVTLNNGGVIQSTGGGAIAITGTGGGTGGSGASNYGVLVTGAIAGSGGAISITGTGGNSSGAGNQGINHGAFAISNTGTGSITLNGTGGGTGANETGYFLFGGSITAGTGNISITGQGSTTANDGVGVLLHGTGITTAGAGTITIAGTATGMLTAAREDAAGIDMPNITAVDGLISITGINNSIGSIDGNSGAHLTTSAQVISTGLGGVKVNGVGGGSGATSFSDYGVQINGGNTIQSTGGGAITITGTGGDAGGSGATNIGVLISSGGVLAGSGGAISITGTGGNSSGSNNYGISLISTVTNSGNGTITLLGTGTGTGASGNDYGVNLTSGSLTTVNGLIKVTGISNSVGTGGNNGGIQFGAANNIRTTGTGGITIVGFGGGTGAGAGNSGVVLSVANAIQSTAGGAITITGTGGGNGGSGTNNNGVNVFGTLAGSGGAISITGTGGNSSGANNAGISQTAVISNTGAGSITLNGTGGGSGSGENGYLANAGITAGTGNISITGVSSANATINNNRGVLLAGTVSTAGAGTITIVGTALGSGSGASAVSVTGTVTAVDGLISITGTDNSVSTGNGNNGVNINTATGAVRSTGIGGIKIVGQGGGSGASGSNAGVTWNAGGVIQSTGGGAVTITGTGGGNGGSGTNNYGVLVGGAITGSGGTISITGTAGNSSGSDNVGIAQSFAISNTGSGGIILNGTGGGTGFNELGYRLLNTSITAGTGDISVTGAASATASGLNDGILLSSSSISTGGAGKITLLGTATGNGVGNVDSGVNLSASTLSAVDGLISITGVNNSTGTGFFHLGVSLTTIPANVINSGNGGVAITGFGGGSLGSVGDHGVEIGTVQWGGSGAITITGTGGDNGGFGAGSSGVQFDQAFTGTGGAITLTGTGGNSGMAGSGIFFGAALSNSGTGGVTLNGTFGSGIPGNTLTSVAAGAGTITLNTAGNVTSSGALTGANLVLLGANASYTLTNAGNAVTTLAANTGSLNYSQTADLTIGTVGAVAGVTATGPVKIASNGGNLTIASGGTVSSTSGGINALILQAGASTSAPTATGGDFINNAGPNALSTPNAFWVVYTGHLVGSGTVDGGLSYSVRYNTDTSFVTPSGPFMLFRSPPPSTPVTASLTGTLIKTYDGTLLATLGASNYSLSGVNPVDQSNVILTVNGTAINLPTYGSFSTRNVGSDLQVTVTGLGLIQPVSTTYQLTSTTISANIGFINPAQLTLSAVSDQKPYDGTTASSATPIVSNLQTGDSVTGLTQAFASRNVLGVAGSTLVVNNYVLADGNNGNNYDVQTVNAAGTITPAQLTVSAVSDTKVYDGTTASSATPSVSGLQVGDNLIGLQQAFTSKNVMGPNGSTLVVSYALDDGNGGNNYAQSVFSAPGTITAALLAYVADPVTRTYGTSIGNGNLTGSLGGLQGSDTQAMVVKGKIKFKTETSTSANVGSYAITGRELTVINPNYQSVIGQDPGNATALTVVPAQLTYKANNASRTYGAADPVVTGTVTGFVLGQNRASATTGTLEFIGSADIDSNVGSYEINGFGLTANNGNYYFVQAAGNATALTINPATLTYVANKASRAQGTPNPDFTGTVTGFVLGQDMNSATTGTLQFTSPATTTSNPGKYAINGSGLAANNGNYVFVQASDNNKALTITH